MWWAFTFLPAINPMGAVTCLGRVASSIVAEWAPSQFDEANGIVRTNHAGNHAASRKVGGMDNHEG